MMSDKKKIRVLLDDLYVRKFFISFFFFFICSLNNRTGESDLKGVFLSCSGGEKR
jgi:hypothetical protein